VTGRGHRAALPAGGHARPEYLVADGQCGLLVRHYNRDGKVREYDFTKMPVAGPMQASLAGLFAARCTPDRWSAHATSRAYWIYLQQFAEFVSGQPRPPRDLDELTPRMVRLWRSSLGKVGGASAFWAVSSLLRDDVRLQEGQVADELARRYRAPKSRVQSYSEADFDRITVIARRQFRTALQRIRDNAIHLQRWREGGFTAGSADWVIGEGLDILARTGDLPKYTETRGRRVVVTGKYRRAFGGMSAAATWQRLFLSRLDAVALGVLLVAEFGWNLSVIDRAEVPRASPDPGGDGHPTYRIQLEKPRRGPGHHFETRNITDSGADSPGRLITQALEATRFARAIVEELAPGTNRLIVWRSSRAGRQRAADLDIRPPVGPFCFGIHSDAAKVWAKAEGLDGSPFQRGRRTVIALDRREPGQHSQETHDRHYALPDKRVQARAVEVIAAGAEDAADRAHKAVLAAELRDQAAAGDVETATADCSSYHDSPWPSPDGSCRASFLICLACPCARVHPGHHPRLAHLHETLGSLRSVLPPTTWAADWRDSYDRLEDLRWRLGDGVWAQARTRVTDADREVVNHLLTGALSP
jgi:hypothetical protein